MQDWAKGLPCLRPGATPRGVKRKGRVAATLYTQVIEGGGDDDAVGARAVVRVSQVSGLRSAVRGRATKVKTNDGANCAKDATKL